MPAKTNDTPDQPTETPHYHGHRERLRERFYSAGPEALSDYVFLEMALFPALPRRDTKPLAKALLKKFGSFCRSHSRAGRPPARGRRHRRGLDQPDQTARRRGEPG